MSSTAAATNVEAIKLEPLDRQALLDKQDRTESGGMMHELMNRRKSTNAQGNFALYDDEDLDDANPTFLSAYLKSFVGPSSADADTDGHRKVNRNTNTDSMSP